MRKPFIWPKLRNKPKSVQEPEPVNVTEALKVSAQAEKPLRGQMTVAVMIDEVGWFGKDTVPEPPKVEPAAASTAVATAPEHAADPVESLPEVPSDLGDEKPVKWSQAMSKAELMKIAIDLGLTLDDTPTKAEIVEALKAHDSNG